MLRDNLVELIEPMLNSAGADPLALYIHTRTPASDDRLPCLKNPRPEGAESSLTESASSPFQAEPAHLRLSVIRNDTTACRQLVFSRHKILFSLYSQAHFCVLAYTKQRQSFKSNPS